jgi:predicted nucleic acid-binding Zn ribbon protein
MEEIETIQSTLNYRRSRRRKGVIRLNEAVDQLLGQQVSPRQAKYGAVVELWRQILPVELLRHCEITDISGGQLTVRVDSPSYKYELHLCSSEILKELQRQCPKLRITKIKFSIS